MLSFNHAALRRVRSIDDRIATAATVAPTLRHPRPRPRRLVDLVERAGASSAALHVTLATPKRIGALRSRGLGVAVWTVNAPAIAGALGRYGVDAVMTDVPARLVRAAEAAR